MYDLIAAVSGSALPDQPHWPALPPVHVDEHDFAHLSPTCGDAVGVVRPLAPSPVTTGLLDCDCVMALARSLWRHPAAAELSRADTLVHDLSAVPRAREILRARLGAPPEQVAADPHGHVRAVAADRDRDGGRVAHAVLGPLCAAIDRGRSVRSGLADLPQALRAPAQELIEADLPALEDALAGLRRTWTDAVLTALCAAQLASERPVTGTGWLFETGDEAELVLVAARLELLWPGRVHLSPDRTRLAALLPAAVALAWEQTGIGELVTADPAAAGARPIWGARPRRAGRIGSPRRVHTVPAATFAALTGAQVGAALALWQPTHGRGIKSLGPLHALAALRAAAAVLTPAPAGPRA